MPPETTGTPTTVAPPEATPTAPSVPQVPATPARLEMPPTSTEVIRSGDGQPQNFQRMYDHIRGEVQARQSQWDTWTGRTQAQTTQQNETITELRQRLGALQTERDALAQQASTLPQVQERASQANVLETQNERLRTMLSHPEIVAQTQVVTQEQDGQQVEVRSNPYIDLLLNTTLTGDAFAQALNELSTRLGQSDVPVVQTPSPLGMSTPTPTPVPPTTVDELRNQRNEAVGSGDYSLAQAINDQIAGLMNKLGG